jgi:hypothetical protein
MRPGLTSKHWDMQIHSDGTKTYKNAQDIKIYQDISRKFKGHHIGLEAKG